MFLNAQSIVGKIDELTCTAYDIEPDLILVSETWCSENITDAFLSIPGYELHQDMRQDREDMAGGRGGGLLVYSKTGLKILKLDKNADFQQYCKFSVEDVTVYLVYRPPSGGADSINKLTGLIRSAERKSILVGDFNLPDINWTEGHARGNTALLLEATQEKFMEQLVNFKTHIRGNTLDLLLTNIPERVLNVQEMGRLGHSDHVMILTTVAVGGNTQTSVTTQQDWNRADWDSIRQEIAGVDWRSRLDTRSAEESWEILRDTIHEAVARNVPKKKRRNQNRPGYQACHQEEEMTVEEAEAGRQQNKQGGVLQRGEKCKKTDPERKEKF